MIHMNSEKSTRDEETGGAYNLSRGASDRDLKSTDLDCRRTQYYEEFTGEISKK